MIIRKSYRTIASYLATWIPAVLFVVFGSCSDSGTNAPGKDGVAIGAFDRAKLVGSWRSVRLENREIDDFYLRTQLFIDTFGKNNDAATNLRLYNTKNVDSLRRVTQEQFDSSKSMQQQAISNTTLTFNRDSIVYLSFNGAIDTSKWRLGTDNMLTLEDMNVGMEHEKIIWEITELTDTSLVVMMKKDTSYSKVTFHPEGK